jgi:hypothetical protein
MTSFHKDTLLLTEQILSKDVLGKIIASHKKDAYSLKESFLFHIPIEPEVVPIYHENSYKTSWSQVYPLLADIPLPPSIFIFHPFNTLYFMYHEVMYHEDEKMERKSSMRKTTGIGKTTKKVRWSISHKNNNTRAKHPH